MKNKETPRRFNWNLLLTTISTIAAVLSVVSAFVANKIAQESQLPNPSIAYIGQFRDYYDDYKAPCKTQSGSAYWQIEFAVVFDVSNFGGKAISVVGIDYDRKIETFHPLIQATIDYEFFGNREKLDKWLEEHSAPSFIWIEQSREKLVYSGPPITVNPGETHRLILLARESVQIDKSLSPQQALDVLYEVNWSSKISFKFANGDTKQQVIRVIHPFSFQVSRTTPLREFGLCLK
jgi:hypothetical protein